MAVAPWTGHDGHASRTQPLQIVLGQVHGVDREHPRIEEAAVVKELHRRSTRRDPRGIPCTQLLEQLAPWAAAGADEFDLFRRFGQVNAAGNEGIAIQRRADGAKHQRRHRVGCMRRQAAAHALGGHQRADLPASCLDKGMRIRAGKLDQLVEHDRREWTPCERTKCHQGVADIGDDRRTRSHRLVDRTIDGRENLR